MSAASGRIILAPFEKPTDRLEIDWKIFAAVTIEVPVHYTHLHHVVPNHFAGMLMAWEQLLARGYRRVGLVVRMDLAQRGSRQWEAVHALAQSRMPEEDRIPALVLDSEESAEQMAQWLRRERPQAVISRSEGFFETVRREGLRIPADIGYASLNVVDDLPNVSGIVQHRDTMGAVAVDVLNSLLQRNQRGYHPVPQGTVVDGTWQEGRTLRSLPAPRSRRKHPSFRSARKRAEPMCLCRPAHLSASPPKN